MALLDLETIRSTLLYIKCFANSCNRDTILMTISVFQKLLQPFIHKSKKLFQVEKKKKENPGSLLWISVHLKWLTLSTFCELLVSSSLAVYLDVPKLWKTCYTDFEVYGPKWAKTGSVVEQFDRKRILISF